MHCFFFRKNVSDMKCEFWFSLQLLSKTPLHPGRNQQYRTTNGTESSYKAQWYISPILTKPEFSQQILINASNISQKSVQREGSHSIRQVDSQTWHDKVFHKLQTRLKMEYTTQPKCTCGNTVAQCMASWNTHATTVMQGTTSSNTVQSTASHNASMCH